LFFGIVSIFSSGDEPPDLLFIFGGLLNWLAAQVAQFVLTD
jgi:hypothetical protein